MISHYGTFHPVVAMHFSLFFWLLRSSGCTFEELLWQAESFIFIGYSSFFLFPQQSAKGMQKLSLLSFLTADYGISVTEKREDLQMTVATHFTGHFSN